jgi:hypothetical protein
MLQSGIRKPSRFITKEKYRSVTSRFNKLTLSAFAALVFTGSVVAQQPNLQKPVEKPTEQKNSDKKDEKKAPETKDEKKSAERAPTISSKDAAKNATAEQVAESAVFIYGGIGGRQTLNQIRKTAIERGKIIVTNDQGKSEQASYQRWTQRAETLDKEKIRLELGFPTATYSLVFNQAKIFGIVNDRSFIPQDEAARSFENHIVHGLEALLRYKENESTIALNGKEKILGVEYYLLDVTDKLARKTRFYISAKTFRVMMLEYEDAGTKFRRKFYDYNYAQGTLVPYQSTLWAGEKMVEEIEVGTITFGQKVDDALFVAATAG